MDFFVVKEGLSGLTSKALVEKGRNCVDMLTGNASFTFPAGYLTSITTATNVLEQADQEVLFNGGKVAYQAKRTAEKVLRAMLKELAGYITAQAGGVEAKILSAGFEVRRKGEPIEKLASLIGLRPLPVTFSGQLELRWGVVPDAINYNVFVNTVGPDQEDAWELIGFTSKARFTADALEPAKYYWFRVQATGRKGLRSPMSQVVKALA
nr:fibronectin type III domain-containing protein [Flavobacteriales bacterium]